MNIQMRCEQKYCFLHTETDFEIPFIWNLLTELTLKKFLRTFYPANTISKFSQTYALNIKGFRRTNFQGVINFSKFKSANISL